MTVTADDDRHTLTGAYALDALDDEERRSFELHLTTCVDCRAEVAELTATAAHLGVATARPVPTSLRERILAQVGQTRQLPAPPSNVRPLRGASRRAATMLSAAAADLAVLAITLGVVAWQADQRADRLAGETAQLEAEAERVGAVLGAPDAVTAAASVEGGGQASVVASAELGEVVLLTQDLPRLAEDRTYQLWLIGEAIVSGGVVDVPADGDVTYLTAGDLAGVTTIALSVEPQGGSEQPTTTPIFAGELG
jgi:anti-sigma-K factor RskA